MILLIKGVMQRSRDKYCMNIKTDTPQSYH